MSKKMIAFLMAIVMVVSMLPLAALAEETKPETVTPAEVSEDIDQAQKSEAEAIGILTAADELVAMANQQLAQGNLDAAADTVEKANDETAKQAETAEDAAEADSLVVKSVKVTPTGSGGVALGGADNGRARLGDVLTLVVTPDYGY